MNKNKVIFDIIHGFIEVDDLTLSIIDTPEFQRLRQIKQLGAIHYVFPSANHTRFEHSLGVYYLAGELINNLKRNQKELEITDKEIQLIKIAGLVHDLGHGPFSHLFDIVIKEYCNSEYIIHERRSILILKYIVDKYNIKLSVEDIDLIGNLIYPEDVDFKNIQNDRHFLYEIISNNRNGIDVDKFDYLKRDTFYLGLSFSLDCSRIIKSVRVIDGKLCYLDKSYYHILEMFEIRNKLHKQIYKHKTVIGIELSIIDNLKINLKNINNLLNNPSEFCKYNDYNLISQNRKLSNMILETIQEEDLTDKKYKNLDFKIKSFKFGYLKSPFENIYFYNRNNLAEKFKILKDNLANTREIIYRIYN